MKINYDEQLEKEENAPNILILTSMLVYDVM